MNSLKQIHGKTEVDWDGMSLKLTRYI